jgi:hypothetical protein
MYVILSKSGCLNGGAQVRLNNSIEGNQSRDLSVKLENDYHQLEGIV